MLQVDRGCGHCLAFVAGCDAIRRHSVGARAVSPVICAHGSPYGCMRVPLVSSWLKPGLQTTSCAPAGWVGA